MSLDHATVEEIRSMFTASAELSYRIWALETGSWELAHRQSSRSRIANGPNLTQVQLQS